MAERVAYGRSLAAEGARWWRWRARWRRRSSGAGGSRTGGAARSWRRGRSHLVRRARLVKVPVRVHPDDGGGSGAVGRGSPAGARPEEVAVVGDGAVARGAWWSRPRTRPGRRDARPAARRNRPHPSKAARGSCRRALPRVSPEQPLPDVPEALRPSDTGGGLRARADPLEAPARALPPQRSRSTFYVRGRPGAAPHALGGLPSSTARRGSARARGAFGAALARGWTFALPLLSGSCSATSSGTTSWRDGTASGRACRCSSPRPTFPGRWARSR